MTHTIHEKRPFDSLEQAETTHHLFDPFRRLADSIPHVVWLTQLHPERVIYVSPSFETIWGRTPQQLYDDPRVWTACIHPGDRERVEREFVGWITGTSRKCQKLEYRVVQPSGALRWVTDYGVVTFDEHGKAIRVSGVVTDITELKLAEREHLQHLWFFESLDRVNQAIQSTELETMVGEVLDQLLNIFECEGAWLALSSAPGTAQPGVLIRQRQLEGLQLRAVDDETRALLELSSLSSDVLCFGHGHEPPLATAAGTQSSMCCRLGPQAGPSSALGLRRSSSFRGEEQRLFREIGRRLTDAVATLSTFRSLRESEARLEAAQRQAHLGYWSLDLATERMTWSAETFRICGMEPQDLPLCLAQVKKLVHPGDLDRVSRVARRAMLGSEGLAFEHRVVRPSSELRYVHTEGHVVRDAQGKPRGLFGTAQDITARKTAEHLFAAQHAVTKLLAESSTPEDAAPRIVQAICETLSWDVGVLWQPDDQGRGLRTAELWCSPDLAGLPFMATLRETRQSESDAGLQAPWFEPDLAAAGTPRWAAAARAGLHSAFGFSVPDGDGVWGKVEFASHEARRPDPDLLATMATMASQIGQFVERRKAEAALQQAREQLAHVTRVASLGELTASIAHEVNQPLTGIIANAHAALRWLAREPADVPEAVESLQRLARDGKRAGEVVGRLREMVRRGEDTRRARVDVNQVVRETLPLIKREVQEHEVTVRLELDDDLPHALADRVQVQQVVLNLLMNALEAMSRLSAGPRELSIRSAGVEPDSVLVAVADTGLGVEAAHAGRVFDAFFTTKPQGMGMGLAISRSIVEAHHGRLTLEMPGAPSRGSVFQFTLPRAPHSQ
jgi:PAS domain S-box-containing protein